jgi:hypothetical protein
MCFFSSSLSFAWDFSTRHPAISLVFLGVLGEGVEIVSKVFFEHWYKKYERPIEIIGAVFWIVVVIGLAFEIPEASRIDKETSGIEAENLVLRSNVVALESAVQWRTITPAQTTNFFNLLHPFARTNSKAATNSERITISASIYDNEALWYGKRLGDALLLSNVFNVVEMINQDPKFGIASNSIPTGLGMFLNGSKNPPLIAAILDAFRTNGIILNTIETNFDSHSDSIMEIRVWHRPDIWRKPEP